MRTIRVTGKGSLRIKPDVTRITLSLEGTCPEYGETLRRSAEDAEQLKDLLTGFGFARSDLRTLNFHVDTEYESCKEKGAFKQRFIGYRFRHLMKVEFASDNDRLGRLLFALSNCPVKPELRLSYTVRDPEAVKNDLLGKAVTDAKGKAAVLAGAAGIALKGIQSIDYSWDQVDLEVHPMGKLCMEECCDSAELGAGRYDMDIEPDDIEVSDTVTVIWEIA